MVVKQYSQFIRLSTIGDPLSDLESTIAYWKEKGDPYTGINSVSVYPGFISRQEFLELYAEKSERDLSKY